MVRVCCIFDADAERRWRRQLRLQLNVLLTTILRALNSARPAAQCTRMSNAPARRPPRAKRALLTFALLTSLTQVSQSTVCAVQGHAQAARERTPAVAARTAPAAAGGLQKWGRQRPQIYYHLLPSTISVLAAAAVTTATTTAIRLTTLTTTVADADRAK